MHITLLAINWSAVWVQVGQLLLALSLLIVLHEFGHYITARWFGCRVEKFFLFFDPWFALVKKKVGDTVYGIGWLPLGGYVKISGMIDESMDKEAMKLPAQPHEFRSKPAWQRLIIMLGGIIMNVLVAFVIYAFVLMYWGESNIINKSVSNGVWVTDSLFYNYGFRNGDKVISVNGDTVQNFNDLQSRILIGGRTVEVDRNGTPVTINIEEKVIGKLVERKNKRRNLLAPRIPSIVGNYEKTDTGYLSYKGGVRYMDRIVSIEGQPINFMDEVTGVTNNHRNGMVSLQVLRGKDTVNLRSKVSDEGKMEIPYLTGEQYDSMGAYDLVTKKYGFFAAFPAGVKKAGGRLSDYIDQFKLILNPDTEAYKAVGGFKAIGSVFLPVWDWESFWNITAFLSIILAFMNLLPIPALDGGHVMFTLYEMISGRKPNEKFLEYAQMAGMIFLLLLMLYANGNDWFGWGR